MENNAIAEIIKALIQKAASAAAVGNESAAKLGGSLNKPATQQMTDTYLVWEWFPLESSSLMGSDQVIVTAELNRFTKEWNVGLRCIRQMTMNAEEARALGETLLSAYEWRNVWKMHFADLMLGDTEIEPDLSGVDFDSAFLDMTNSNIASPNEITDETDRSSGF